MTPEQPKLAVARAVYTANMEHGDLPFDELDAEERDILAAYAEAHISAHVTLLSASGFRLVPPETLLRPTSEKEAMAMVQLSKEYLDAQKRKPGLVGSVTPKKLILPGRAH